MYSNIDADPEASADADSEMPMLRFLQMAGFNMFKNWNCNPSSNDFLLSYDTSYCERKYRECKESQVIQTTSIFEIFILFLRFKFS